MKIYTRRGDQGMTTLQGGKSVSKSSLRVEACGSVDELNSAVGLVLAGNVPDEMRARLERVQDLLFRLGGDLANPGWPQPRALLEPGAVEEIENWIDELERPLPALKNFILPGGSPASGGLHHARTVCRRAERRVQALAEREPIAETALPLLNRLGDLLFVMARRANFDQGYPERIWKA